MTEEIWKLWPYKKYKNKFNIEVSNLGNVKIDCKLVDFSKLCAYNNDKAYYAICHIYVHRMVAELFIPNPNNYPCVDHINGDIHDNRAENLRWCTQKMNLNYPLAKLNIYNGNQDKGGWNKGLKGCYTASEETRRKKSASMMGKNKYKKTAEHRRKLSESNKWKQAGEKNPMYGTSYNWLNNGIERVYCPDEEVEYYLNLGYHRGWKIK